MAYQVLALKYRPQTFRDVIGQQHVTTTLINAIQSNRVAHAILFSGPRGTGKTTIARILAKAMNCVKGPTPEPCNQCRSCTAITSGSAADVFEIDGASNNSVDQVRELRDNITYMPSASAYKIYIIDEVHMLSTAAFNALLKTLEEPPAHVIFIFATTEAHKIPVTILSRCQRHDLGRIPLTGITDHLRNLCEREGFTLSGESLELIAAEADGSMRDSLSLLDRILSSSDSRTISHEALLRNLGIIDKSLVMDMTLGILARDAGRALGIVAAVNDMGLDLKKFYAGLIRQFRNLAVIKICSTGTGTTDLSDEDQARLSEMAAPLSQAYLSQVLGIMIQEEYLVKTFSHTRTALETVLLKLTQIRQASEIDDIIRKLDILARSLEPRDGGNVPSGPAGRTDTATPEPPRVQSAAPQPRTRENRSSASSPGNSRVAESGPVYAETPPADEPQPPPAESRTRSREADGIKRTAADWHGFLKTVSAANLPFAAAILAKGTLKEVTDTAVRVELTPTPFDLSRLESKKADLESACRSFFGKTLELIVLGNPGQQQAQEGPSPARLRQEAAAHPFIAGALTLFNGTIVDVQSS